MPGDQIFIGSATCVLCLAGLWQHAWLMEHSRYGRGLVRWFGHDRAPWILRGLLALGALFGALLAVGIVNPIRW